MLHRLIKTADVLVENFRPGVAERLGIGWEGVAEINPRLIYASISGFGQTGPYAERPGFDLIAQLIARERTGRGQSIDTSLFEGALALSIWETAELWATGRTPEALGSAHRLLAPYQALRTSDGHVTVGANSQRMWGALCDAIGRVELTDDPRFADNDARMSNRVALVESLEAALAGRTTGEWVEVLIAAGVPCGPIHDYAQVFEDPHTRAREMRVEVEHPVEGTVSALGIPVKMSDTPGNVRRPAPMLGEHTAEVLREAGIEDMP